MLELVCGIPGADPATIGWHAAIHLGLTAFVTAAGTGFLVAAVRAYRRAPVAERA
jgi:hypothetical protein